MSEMKMGRRRLGGASKVIEAAKFVFLVGILIVDLSLSEADRIYNVEAVRILRWGRLAFSTVSRDISKRHSFLVILQRHRVERMGASLEAWPIAGAVRNTAAGKPDDAPLPLLPSTPSLCVQLPP